MNVNILLKSFLAVTILSLIASCAQEDFYLPDQHSESEQNFLRSEDELMSYAVSAYNKLFSTKSRSTKEVKNIVPVSRKGRSEIKNEVYAVNFSDNGGYVLTTTNPNIEPILAVIEEGTFDEENLPDGVRYFIEAAQNYNPEPLSIIDPTIPVDTNQVNFQHWELRTDTIVYNKIEPQLEVWWGQDNLYSYFTPTYFNTYQNRIEHVKIGCVPTAIGMAMTFTKHRSNLPITFDGRQEILNLNWPEILKHKKYDMRCDIEPIWLSGDCEASPETHLTIATLLRQIGELCNVDYDNLNPSASFSDAYNCISQLNFNFESASSNDGFTYNRVHQHLNNDEILIMFGQDNRGQTTQMHNNHCFIIDGCDCFAYRVTCTIYEEVHIGSGTVQIPIESYVEEEYASYLAHVVWGLDELGVGYFSDNILRTISPRKLDEGANSWPNDYYYTHNTFIRIKRNVYSVIPDLPEIGNN